jgi:hypothetical protein
MFSGYIRPYLTLLRFCLVHATVLFGYNISEKYVAYSKPKTVPLRHEGDKEETKYSSYSFSNSALDGGEWSVPRPDRALAPGKGHPVPIVQEAGRAPEPVWTQRIQEKSFGSAGDRILIALSSSPQSDTILPELPGCFPLHNTLQNSTNLWCKYPKQEELVKLLFISLVKEWSKF